MRLRRRVKSSDFASILLSQRELFGIGVFFVFQILIKSEAIEGIVEALKGGANFA